MSTFTESDHPRDEHGRFTNGVNPSTVTESGGIKYKKPFAEYKDDAAAVVAEKQRTAEEPMNERQLERAMAKAWGHKFFLDNLNGSAVETEWEGRNIQIYFTHHGTWGKFRGDIDRDPKTVELLPIIPDVIKNGECKFEDSYKENRDDKFLDFLRFTKQLTINGTKRNVIVKVGRRDPKSAVHEYTAHHFVEDRKKHPSPFTGDVCLTRLGCSDTDIISKTYEVINFEIEDIKEKEARDKVPDNRITISLDAKPSARSRDENGFLHVGASHITKAAVNPYYGREIPGYVEAGLEPGRIYYGLRDPDELKKSLSTWEGLPLHIEHHVDSAENPEKLTRVGAIGTGVVWNAPYIDAPLTVWDEQAIKAIEDGTFKELSCAYRYEPDFTKGTYEGADYDFVMRDIRGNHVALVEEGRAGPDVVVADSKPVMNGEGAEKMDEIEQKKAIKLARAIVDLHKVDPQTGEVAEVAKDEEKAEVISQIIRKLVGQLKPEDFAALKDAVASLPEQDDVQHDEEPEAEAHGFPPEPDAKTGDEAEPESILLKTDEEDDAEDEEPEEEAPVSAAMDRKTVSRIVAQDSAFISRIKREAAAEAAAHIQNKYKAAEVVRPLVGSLDAMGFDSAADIYGYALEQSGIDKKNYPRAAWRGMVDVLRAQKMHGRARMAEDAAAKRDGVELNLGNIILS